MSDHQITLLYVVIPLSIAVLALVFMQRDMWRSNRRGVSMDRSMQRLLLDCMFEERAPTKDEYVEAMHGRYKAQPWDEKNLR